MRWLMELVVLQLVVLQLVVLQCPEHVESSSISALLAEPGPPCQSVYALLRRQ